MKPPSVENPRRKQTTLLPCQKIAHPKSEEAAIEKPFSARFFGGCRHSGKPGGAGGKWPDSGGLYRDCILCSDKHFAGPQRDVRLCEAGAGGRVYLLNDAARGSATSNPSASRWGPPGALHWAGPSGGSWRRSTFLSRGFLLFSFRFSFWGLVFGCGFFSLFVVFCLCFLYVCLFFYTWFCQSTEREGSKEVQPGHQ